MDTPVLRGADDRIAGDAGPDAQREYVEKVMEEPVLRSCGQEMMLISHEWMEKWRSFVGWKGAAAVDEVHKPGTIDNTSFVSSSSELTSLPPVVAPTAREGIDFEVVPAGAWKCFVAWYGGGQPCVSRRVIATGVTQAFQVEVYPYVVDLVALTTDGFSAPRKALLGRQTAVREALNRACALWDVSAEKTARLWRVDETSGGCKLAVLESQDATLEDSEVVDGHRLAVEVCGADGKWPRDALAKGALGEEADEDAGKAGKRGRCGLRNLGNTCFMNSALQCLSNTMPLTNLLLKDLHARDINPINPLGTGGRLVEAYAGTVKELWLGTHDYAAPIRFKQVLGKFAPQFSGFQQQDSHELLGYLLDGLHEDLNRVRDKPATETIEAQPGEDHAVVAERAWLTHLARNNSVITELFYGQLKSTIVCPDCDRVSVTFDPVTALSVPLPKRSRKIPVLAFPADGVPVQCAVEVARDGKIDDVAGALAATLPAWHGRPRDMLLLAETANHRILHAYDPAGGMGQIGSDDCVYAYEMPRPEKGQRMSRLFLHMRHAVGQMCGVCCAEDRPACFSKGVLATKKCGGCKRAWYCSADHQKRDWAAAHRHVCATLKEKAASEVRHEFGFPFVVTYVGNATNRDVYRLVHQKLRRYLREGSAEETEFPFKLSIVVLPHKTINTCARSGGECSRAGCMGCALPVDDRAFVLYDGERLCVDFTAAAARTVIDFDFCAAWEPHSSALDLAREVSGTGGGSSGQVTLDECLALFSEEERLDQDNMWYCSRCGDHKQATKTLEPYRLPPCLVVHLKRFQRRGWTGFHGVKLNDPVSFPLRLDVGSVVRKPADGPGEYLYELNAVSCHMGTMYGGHYTAYAKNDGKWFKYDDKDVFEVSEKHVLGDTTSAYLLFYQRVGSV